MHSLLKGRTMSKNKENQSYTPYKNCLNCGAELNGKFCHECGQQVTNPNPSIWGFVFEYFSNAIMWDPRFFKSLWTLIKKPGLLTQEFISGKFISYIHPLKMNMFLLFILLTLFIFFSGTEKLNNSIQDLAENKDFISYMQFDSAVKNPEYAKKLEDSPLDTIKLCATLLIAEGNYPYITHIETIENYSEQYYGKWIAVVPSVLIKDKIIVEHSDGFYYINSENSPNTQYNLKIFADAGEKMINLLTKYFPLLILFTAPILSFSLRLVRRKDNLPYINHFIFSLHYTAILESIAIMAFLINLVIDIPMWILQVVFFTSSCAYLTIAFRRVYETKSWSGAICNALLTSFIYALIILLAFAVIFLIACIGIAYTHA